MDVGALQRCVGDVEHFADQVWGKRVMVHGRTAQGFEDLLSLDAVDQLLSERALCTPMFRLIREGRPLPMSDYTRSARIGGTVVTGVADPARIFAAVEQGATLVLQGLHRYWTALADFCRELELSLGHPCQVNAYLTPPNAQGLRPHSDRHDVLVLQAFGAKSWQIWPAPGEQREGDQYTSVDLEPGAALYMPTGTTHAARAQHGLSGHLTIGIHPTRWRDLVQTAVTRVLNDAEWDAPLPVRYHRDPAPVVSELSRHFKHLGTRLMSADPQHDVDDLVDRFFTARPPALRGGLVDRLRASTLDDSVRVRRRAGSVCEIRAQEGGKTRVLLGDRELRVPSWLEPAVREVAVRNTFTVWDLAGHLDPASRLVLVRRLIREGLLEVADG